MGYEFGEVESWAWLGADSSTANAGLSTSDRSAVLNFSGERPARALGRSIYSHAQDRRTQSRALNPDQVMSPLPRLHLKSLLSEMTDLSLIDVTKIVQQYRLRLEDPFD